jgi:membrane glycosyltransferase
MSAPIGSQTANIAMTAGMPPKRISRTRRATFFSLVGLGTIVGAWLSFIFLSENGMRISEWALLLVFIPLYYQLNVGFWTALFGVWLMNRPKPDPLNLWLTLTAEDYEQPITASTAIVMPVFNEDVTRVYEGLRSIYLSLEATGPVEELRLFHPQRFRQGQPVDRGGNRLAGALPPAQGLRPHLLPQSAASRSTARAATSATSAAAGAALPLHGRARCGQPHVRRPAHQHGAHHGEKSRHRHHADLPEADRRRHAARPRDAVRAGALRAAFMAGLDYWQCGEANFWGHNAILRLAPFIEHCALPPLPANAPFGGHILSHDFVEAALMRKAGYAVRLLPTTRGSYEEGPPTLVDMLKRDRRWCQGNIQHLWLLFAKGWHPMSRVNFLHGILSYVSSLLWFSSSRWPPISPPHPPHKAPQAILAEQILLGLTAMLIFLPKTVILLDEVITGRMFKPLKLRLLTFFSSLLDTVVFTLMAPVLMIFHSRFVIYTLIGKSVNWVTQRRKIDGGINWSEIIFTFASVTLLGIAWAALGWLSRKPSSSGSARSCSRS